MRRRRLLVSAATLTGVGTATWVTGGLFAQTEKPMSGSMKMGDGMGEKSGQMQGMQMGTYTPEPSPPRIKELPTGAPLPEIRRLENTSKESGLFMATIEAAPTTVEFVPGIKSTLLAYNGSVPGMMIDVNEGDRVKILFRNRIPKQDSTIHWHGIDVPPTQDGNPMEPVVTGQERLYEFTLPPYFSGSYWYHPHPHSVAAEQVYRGLAGPFIVRDKHSALPPELGDTILMISSISLDMDGSVSENTFVDNANGREGDHILVNGTKQPYVTVAPGSSRRFRIYNATNGRYLRLAFEGHEMTLIGTDGGLIGSPVPGLKEIMLAPAERAEVVVHFQATPGTVSLMDMPYDRGWMIVEKPKRDMTPVLTVKIAGEPKTPIRLPDKLRDVAPLGVSSATKRLTFGEIMDMSGSPPNVTFTIDGKVFELGRVDLTSKAGAVEIWEISNPTDMDHPMHIHGSLFQVIERTFNNATIPEKFVAWKDTVNIRPGEIVRIKIRQEAKGRRVYHCHILEHEDNGMMGTLEVV